MVQWRNTDPKSDNGNKVEGVGSGQGSWDPLKYSQVSHRELRKFVLKNKPKVGEICIGGTVRRCRPVVHRTEFWEEQLSIDYVY